MTRKLTTAAVLAAVLLGGQTLPAQDNPARTLSKYINNQTLFILQVRLDPRQVQALLDRLAALYPPGPAATQPSQSMVGQLKKAYADISRLGVSEFYFVGPWGTDWTLIVPLKAGADAAAVAKAFGFERAYDPMQLPDVDRRVVLHTSAYLVDGKFLLLGTQSGLADLKDRGASQRPAFGDGFDALDDAPARLVVAPTAPMLDLLSAQHETLSASLGKVQTKSLLSGLQWAAATASVSPAKLDVIAQTRDEATARGISAAADQVLAAARNQAGGGATLAGQSDLPAMLLAGLAPSLKLQAKGPTLRLSLDDKQIGNFLDKTLPESLTAVQHGKRFEHAQLRIRAIAAAFKFYLAEHKEYPPDLQTLQDDLGVKNMFAHPVNPQITPGYIYIKPAEAGKKVLMVYENYPTFPALGVFVAFADGSTTLVANEEQFKKLLAEAKK